jgi:hypothetical protein
LDKERGKQVAEFLFINVPEVEIKIGYQRLASIEQGDIFYDRGTELMMSVSQTRNESKNGEPDHSFPSARYRNRKQSGVVHHERQE